MVQNSKRRRNNAAIWKILLIAKVIAKNDTKSPIFRPLDRFWKFCSVGSSLNTVLLLFWKFHDDSSKNGQDTAYIFSIFNCESEESQNRRKIKRTKRARWITRVILEHMCEYFLWLTLRAFFSYFEIFSRSFLSRVMNEIRSNFDVSNLTAITLFLNHALLWNLQYLLKECFGFYSNILFCCLNDRLAWYQFFRDGDLYVYFSSNFWRYVFWARLPVHVHAISPKKN